MAGSGERPPVPPGGEAPSGPVDHDELDTKIMRSSAWSVVGYGGANVLSLVTAIVLARLLVPEDFGLVALTLALLAIAQLVQESGLGAALIVYRGNLRPAAASAALFSPVVASLLYSAAFVAAPYFADLFEDPRLTNVMRVMALTLILRGFAVMPMALLQREMRFASITAAELAGGVGQAAVALVLAWAGAGVWSLVAGHIALAATQAVAAWSLAPFRPSPFEARWESLRELMGFGRRVGAANILKYCATASEGVVIGRLLGAAQLGYYSLASRLGSMPLLVIRVILSRGVFAALARVHGDLPAFRRIWLENVQRVALLSIPASIGIALTAKPLVVALLGAQWLPAVVPLQLLALTGVVKAFAATTGEVVVALHRPEIRLRFDIAVLALTIPALVIGAEAKGIDGAAAGIFIVNSLLGVVFVAVTMRLVQMPARRLLESIVRPAAGWVLLAAALLLVRPAVDGLPAGAQLIVLLVVGACVYALAVALFARRLVASMWVSLRGARTSA